MGKKKIKKKKKKFHTPKNVATTCATDLFLQLTLTGLFGLVDNMSGQFDHLCGQTGYGFKSNLRQHARYIDEQCRNDFRC